MSDEINNSNLTPPVEPLPDTSAPAESKKSKSSNERVKAFRARERAKKNVALTAQAKVEIVDFEKASEDVRAELANIKTQRKKKDKLLKEIRAVKRNERDERRLLRDLRKQQEAEKQEVEDVLTFFASEKELVKIGDIVAFHAGNPLLPTPNVREQLAYMTLEAAKIWGVPPNRYTHAHGSKILEARKKNTNIIPKTPEGVGGGCEVLSFYELSHLYDRATLGGTHDFLATIGQSLDFPEWLQKRNQFVKDPAFACLMTEHPIDPDFHTQLLDFLPHWNFDGLYPQNYTLKDFHEAMAKQPIDGFKEFVNLVFRGAWKSTLGSVVCAQLICGAPDVRIGLLSGSEETAADLLKLMKSYFLQVEGAPLSDFQRLFPEFVVRGQDPMSDEDLLIPARKHFQKEPSLWSGSPKQVLASKHVEVLVLDDVVSATTSGSEETRKTLHAILENAKNLVDSWGLVLQIGTPWTKGDYWDERLEAAEEDRSIKTLIVPVWTLKPESREKSLRELTIDDVEKFAWENQAGNREKTFQSLRRKIISDEPQFRTQQLIQWTGDEDNIKVNFTEAQIRACTRDPQTLPAHYRLVQTWDSGFRDANRCDRSAGICAAIFVDDRGKNCLLVRDLVVDRFKPSELGMEIAAYAKKWLPAGLGDIMIEKVLGSEWLDEKIQTAAQKQLIKMPTIFWRKIETGPLNKNIKSLRISKLELLMDAGRLFFSTTMPTAAYDKMIAEFLNFDPKVKGRKVDILDALARASEYLGPDISDNNQEMEKHLQEVKDAQERQQQYERIFGGGSQYVKSTPSEAEQYEQLSPRVIADSPLLRVLDFGGKLNRKGTEKMSFQFMRDKPFKK